MKRRALIKTITLATGSAICIPLSGTLLTACKEVKPVNDADYTPKFFEPGEFSTIQDLLNTILPETDSPSATAVGVHQILDTMAADVYTPEQQAEFDELFNALSAKLTAGDMTENLRRLLSSEEEEDKGAKAGLLNIKQQAVAYYLSTEEIATNYLNYMPNPGVYEACIPLETVNGKAWAI